MELVLFSDCDMNYILHTVDSFISPRIVNVKDLLECS